MAYTDHVNWSYAVTNTGTSAINGWSLEWDFAGNESVVNSWSATVAVDSKGRVYGIESGSCSGGQVGKAHVLDAKLEETGTIALGECPVGSAVVQIPPE